MKRRFIAVSLALLVIIAAMPFFAMNKAEASPSDETLLAAYRAYYNVLRDALDMHGSIRLLSESDEWGYHHEWLEGVIYAELIDLDNDGLPEFFFVLGTGDSASMELGRYAVVYGFPGRLERFGFFQSFFSYMDDAFTGMFGIAHGRDNLSYFVYDEFYHNDWGDSYFTIVDGVWTLAMQRYAFINHEAAHYEDFEVAYVDGTRVSIEEYVRAREAHLGVTGVRWVEYNWRFCIAEELLSYLQSRIDYLEYTMLPPDPPSGTAPSEYVYIPPAHSEVLMPPDGAISRISDVSSANEAIRELISSMTPEQRRSGDALNTAALFIENAVRAGANTAVAGDFEVSYDMLYRLADTAFEIRARADRALNEEDLRLLRQLRTNVSVVSDEAESLRVAFPVDVSDIPFDNITIEAGFASVTLKKDSIRAGDTVEIRKLIFEDEEEGDGGSGGRERRDDRDDSWGGSAGGLWDGFNPLDFWAVGAVVLVLITWGVLAACKHRFKAWVVPVFCGLAIAVNAGTYFLLGSNQALEEPGRRRPAASDDEQGGRESQPRAVGVEVVLSEGMSATVSLPAMGGDRGFLMLFSDCGELQLSKLNPVTGMIDGSIRESGSYVLREHRLSFGDIERKDAMMREAIVQLTSRGIMSGVSEHSFQPDDAISRAELVSAIVRAFDLLDPDAESSFLDVSRGEWFYAAVATAQREGIVRGFGDGTFRGDQAMPKDQMTQMFSNTLVERMGYLIPHDVEVWLARYLDRSDLAQWSEGAIALATQSNIMIDRADSMFAPSSSMTRGDAAIVLYRVFQRVW